MKKEIRIIYVIAAFMFVALMIIGFVCSNNMPMQAKLLVDFTREVMFLGGLSMSISVLAYLIYVEKESDLNYC